jgi:hypothetical protein
MVTRLAVEIGEQAIPTEMPKTALDRFEDRSSLSMVGHRCRSFAKSQLYYAPMQRDCIRAEAAAGGGGAVPQHRRRPPVEPVHL